MNFGKHVPSAENRNHRFGPTSSPDGGRQWRFRFANGYGASVINDGYGGDQGLYELAVLGSDSRLTYDTPVTDDVLGYLTVDEVAAALDQIEALEAVQA